MNYLPRLALNLDPQVARITVMSYGTLLMPLIRTPGKQIGPYFLVERPCLPTQS
jgi:hypothetical protein